MIGTKNRFIIIILFFFLITGNNNIHGQSFGYGGNSGIPSGIIHYETNSDTAGVNGNKDRFPNIFLSIIGTYAYLETQVRFITPSELLSFQVGLEKHLGLPKNSMIFSGNLIWRLTESSGIYAMYYGLSRTNKIVIEDDIIVPEDTLKAGSYIEPYFKTNIFSLGYLLSILKSRKSYLAAYFNVYVMDLRMGMQSNIKKHDHSYELLMPLPDIGLVMQFELADWFRLGGNVGFFYINNINDIGGSINEVNVYAAFAPNKWLAFSLGFNMFNVRVKEKLENDFKIEADYNFIGPSASIVVKF